MYSLYLPAEGVDVTLIKNEFNLLTSNVSENRPLYITETFELPLDENRRVFEELKGVKKTCQLIYNDIVMISGALFEYSVDEQRKVVLVTITSGFKDIVDYMGDNILYLDKIDLSRWDYIVPSFDKNHSNELLKFGYYNPMDTNTGSIEFNKSNIDDFCKPSLNVLGYFKEVFRLNEWTANWEAWTDKQSKVCIMPTTAYMCSSWGYGCPQEITIDAYSEWLMPLSAATEMWNIVKDVQGVATPGAEVVAVGAIQVRQPNRLMSFKLKAIYNTVDTFSITIKEGEKEMAFLQSLGDDTICYTTDSVNLQEGIDPLSVVLSNPNPHPITIKFMTLDFYNLFSVYETNQDNQLQPQGYMYPVSDNYPKITALELYQQFLTLFQMAQSSEDSIQEVDYYFLNDIASKNLERVDVNPYLFWNGYEILSDKINGLAKLNAIRYKEDKKRQRYFKVDIAPLPASGVYFESLFAHGETNNGWNAVQVPSLTYKVKTIEENIPVEYLEYSEITPQLGYYDEVDGKMLFQPLHITTIVQEYWSNLLTFMSSFDDYTPVVYKLRLRLFYYEYLNLFQQRNLFYYQSNCLLLSGTYDVINQTFEGTFISLR